MKILITLAILAALIAGTWLLYSTRHQGITTTPYDETADAKAVLKTAFASAKLSKKPLLVVFGANWCPDCRALDQAMHEESNSALVTRSFIVVKIDIGDFDKNLDISKAYGDITKKGIPSIALLSPDGEIIYATLAGELARAKRMGTNGIHNFLSDVAQRGRLTSSPP